MRVFGKSVLADRQRLQLSQAALGKLVGVTQQAVAKWEGGVVPESQTLRKLLEVLGDRSDTARLAATSGLTLGAGAGSVGQQPAHNRDLVPMRPASPQDLEALRTLAQAASDIARAAQAIAASVARMTDSQQPAQIESPTPAKNPQH